MLHQISNLLSRMQRKSPPFALRLLVVHDVEFQELTCIEEVSCVVTCVVERVGYETTLTLSKCRYGKLVLYAETFSFEGSTTRAQFIADVTRGGNDVADPIIQLALRRQRNLESHAEEIHKLHELIGSSVRQDYDHLVKRCKESRIVNPQLLDVLYEANVADDFDLIFVFHKYGLEVVRATVTIKNVYKQKHTRAFLFDSTSSDERTHKLTLKHDGSKVRVVESGGTNLRLFEDEDPVIKTIFDEYEAFVKESENAQKQYDAEMAPLLKQEKELKRQLVPLSGDIDLKRNHFYNANRNRDYRYQQKLNAFFAG